MTEEVAAIEEVSSQEVVEQKVSEAQPAQLWRDDWRQNIAKELGMDSDEKFLKQLERFTTPAAVTKSWLSANQQIRSGELRKALSENPSEDELKAYRAENGVPESADKYDFSLPDGTVFGEEDKANLKGFAEAAYAQNMNQAQLQSVLGWYQGQMKAQEQQQEEFDSTYAKDAEDTLRAEWGGEYRSNVNAVAGVLSALPEGVRGQLEHARLPDGSKLGNNPDFLRFMAGIARELNPASTILPSSSKDVGKDIASMKAEIKAMMRDRKSAYYTDGGATREKYNELLQAEEKLQRRSA